MYIHKEGFPTIAITVLFIALLNGTTLYAFPNSGIVHIISVLVSLFLLITVLQFFRNPKRNTIQNSNAIIAPADGKVVVIEETTETEYLKTKCIQVSIFMSPINVHVNRYPISGTVSYAKYHPGKYLVAWHPKSSTENERTSIAVKHTKGYEILFRQIAGALARRIVYYAKENDTAMQGSEFGFIKFGSRVDLYLPLTAKIKVELNQKTIGGETIIAEV
ncbi:MAG: phosphatidylserine decarboxylase family protein [Bacteroidetes bacterium]|nr:phosphatidylserine decarboxylase family protein [Bacteroidota bacterium]